MQELTLTLALTLAAGCASRVVLHVPRVSVVNGQHYVCTVDGCQRARAVNPALFNPVRSRHVVLPHECDGRVGSVMVDGESVHVRCAAPERGIE